MKTRFAVIALLLLFVTGCTRPSPLAPGTFAMRIAANEADHLEIIALAKDTPGKIVLKDGKTVAEWLPAAANSLASQQIGETDDFIIREVGGRTEVLLVHGAFDVTEGYIRTAAISDDTDADGHPYVEIMTNADGARLTRELTRSNLPDYANELYRNIAMVVRGQVYSLPRIEREVGSHVIISTTSPEHAEKIVAFLNEKVQ